MKKTIVVKDETHERLRKYKSAKSAVKDRDLSYDEAIVELLDDSVLLSEWMKGKK